MVKLKAAVGGARAHQTAAAVDSWQPAADARLNAAGAA